MSDNLIKYIREINEDKIKEVLQYKGEQQEKLFETARKVRNEGKFQNKVELRSVIELSNVCSQKCSYCSISKDGKEIYTLSREVTEEKIDNLAKKGRRTFLIQSGENKNQKFIDDVSFCCENAIKKYPDIKIVLCLGNLSDKQYKQLKETGAQRYILKFETSNPEHHKFCRPNDTIENRLDRIQTLIDLGFQVGSGNIAGLPKQTLGNLIEDLKLIDKLNLSMVSSTRFISNKFSKFGEYPDGDIDLTLNFLAILRILKPDCLIPSTTSLAFDKKNGQKRGLTAGCNTITIHDGTPKEFENKYSIYSSERFSPQELYCREIIEECGMISESYLI